MKKLYFHLPGIILFLAFLVAGLASYQDYGMAWDEPPQKYLGELNYKVAFKNDDGLFNTVTDLHGAAFEVPLIFVEEKFGITDSRDIFLMRHIFSHIFFLLALLYGYFYLYRYFGSRALACLGFIMLALSPRLYAHSFFNSKDMPFVAMTIIIMGLFYQAFRTRKPVHFALLGLACGYTTGIRVLGVMFVAFILGFLLIDLAADIIKKRRTLKTLTNTLLFSAIFFGSLCLFWPYLWRTPMQHLVECFTAMTHYEWGGSIMFKGAEIKGTNLPWNYFPTWFVISNPEVWLLAGLAGVIVTMVVVLRRPFAFTTDMAARNRLFHLACFVAPIVSVLALHSVIYDDWRHLYFVYVPFVIMALHAIQLAVKTRARIIVWSACTVQAIILVFIMVKNHPFHQVYFNSLVSHKKEYLRHNYEMEYWGCGYMNALNYLVKKHPWNEIKVCPNHASRWVLPYNISMLEARDRDRIKVVPETEATYKITNFRLAENEPEYPNVEYAVTLYNSTTLCIYKLR